MVSIDFSINLANFFLKIKNPSPYPALEISGRSNILIWPECNVILLVCLHSCVYSFETGSNMASKKKKKKKKKSDPYKVLESNKPVTLSELMQMIHRVNPTPENISPKKTNLPRKICEKSLIQVNHRRYLPSWSLQPLKTWSMKSSPEKLKISSTRLLKKLFPRKLIG